LGERRTERTQKRKRQTGIERLSYKRGQTFLLPNRIDKLRLADTENKNKIRREDMAEDWRLLFCKDIRILRTCHKRTGFMKEEHKYYHEGMMQDSHSFTF
jgi:hypothetical protein